MRINSDRSRRILGFIYVICFFSLVFDIILLQADGSWGDTMKISPLAGVFFLFIIYRGLPVFNYDSDGEVLNFTASEPNLNFLGSWFYTHFEFPKRKLVRYRINSYPFRRVLSVVIDSREGYHKKQKIPISYLNKRELKDLRKSLNKVVLQNNENK